MIIIETLKKFFPTIKGRTYFSKETERQLFFILTVIMLIVGIVSGLKSLIL